MKPALIIINDKLLETGMSQVEIDHLMARFLEEEAFDFVKFIKNNEEQNIIENINKNQLN